MIEQDTTTQAPTAPQASSATTTGASPLAGIILLAGAMLTGIILGADLIGVRSMIDRLPSDIEPLWIALSVLAIGFVLDWTAGRRITGEILETRILDFSALTKFLTVTVQLAILVLVVQQFHLENYVLYHKIMLLAFFGFIVHYLLPQQYRLSFFLILSLTGILSVFGWQNGLWLIGIGLVLIGICHLPFPFGYRILALVAAGGALTALRIGYFQTFWSKAIWPILGSMFIFRLVIYLYDLKHRKAPFSFTRSLSYFFLLPNVAFPLFPVVDYSTFCRTYYNSDEFRIYQRGIKWMFWGVTHLLFYRFINYYVVISPEQVTDTASLVQFMVSNYGLIIRLSGQFHLIVGMLHLFGFNLPRIMHHLFLASSFNDYWRRVNIYWKDFIQKIFYYPTYFKLRSWSNTSKLIIATSFGFLMTWFFHAFQWFWIRGSFLLVLPDIIFWSSLGFLVVANSLFESKYGRKRTLGKRSWTVRDTAVRTLKTFGVFATITILWSLWVSPTVGDWLALLANANVTLPELLLAVLSVIAALFVGIVLFERISLGEAEERGIKFSFNKSVAITAVPLLGLYLLGKPTVFSQLDGTAKEIVRDMRVSRLSSRDADLLTRGYYEDLTSVNRFNLQLWEIYMKRPDNWPTLRDTQAGRLTGDFLKEELVPHASIDFHGSPFTVNRWGMRDQDYDQSKSNGTYRFALLGGSFVLGSGVADGETFEWLMEDRINREANAGNEARYEILNFAAPAYSSFQNFMTLRDKVLSFEVDAVIYTAHPREIRNTIRHLVDRTMAGVEIPFDEIEAIVQKAGVDQNTPEAEAYKKLMPYGEELVSWVFEQIVGVCRANNLAPILIYFPVLQRSENSPDMADNIMKLAEDTGFIVIDITDLYDDRDTQALRVAEWDWHPNAEAHQLIAERLYSEFQARGLFSSPGSRHSTNGQVLVREENSQTSE